MIRASFPLPSPIRVLLISALSVTVIWLNVRLSYGFELQFPLDCQVGKTCFIQNYSDHDTSPNFQDYRCGKVLGYDGHDGTDIRVATLKEMRDGVAVLAAAEGEVLGVRDEIPDISIKAPNAPDIKGKECGNGVLIRHIEGFDTQYCHMRQGSLVVKKGDHVQAGQKLGLLGLSGQTEFPHLHLSLRKHDGTKLDPFTGQKIGTSCTASGSSSLWSKDIQSQLSYQPTGILTTGFATSVPSYDAVKDGLDPLPTLTPASPALVFWFHGFGGTQGLETNITVTQPDGSTLVSKQETLPKNQATFFRAIGKKRPPSGWAKGRYTAQVQLRHAGALVASHIATLDIR